jgi:transcriptional regulator with XRE-family HTH domain
LRPEELRPARHAMGLTQQQAAERLGISQAYLAMLERGQRPVTARLASKIVKTYALGPTAMPLESGAVELGNSATLATSLARLGYPGFRHLRGGRRRNPAVVLLAAVAANDLEVRVLEALPWLAVKYADLDWDWLIREAKLRDIQNRLGFLVALARCVADKRGDEATVCKLQQVEEILERARLVREDTLCQESLSNAERQWLRQGRPPDADHWNLLTDLNCQDLPHAA